MPIALYSSPLIPPEWLAAHGWQPCRWQPAPTGQAAPSGACPFAWAWMEALRYQPEIACLILTTECDMMRRVADDCAVRLRKPTFLFDIPATSRGELPETIYRAELERLGRFLVREGGTAPDAQTLIATTEAHAAARQRLIDARERYTPRLFAEAIAAQQRGAPLPPPGAAAPNTTGIPLALVGGPFMPHHFAIHHFIERSGGRIVLDATETGELSLAPAPDPALLHADPVTALVRAYLDRVPTVHRRPNGALYRWLAERLSERGARGILFFHYPWCDPWHGEVERMRQWAPVPLLPIVLEGDEPLAPYLVTRVEAFLESLK